MKRFLYFVWPKSEDRILQTNGKAYRYIDIKKEIYPEILVIKINVLVEVQRISVIVATAKQLIFQDSVLDQTKIFNIMKLY